MIDSFGSIHPGYLGITEDGWLWVNRALYLSYELKSLYHAYPDHVSASGPADNPSPLTAGEIKLNNDLDAIEAELTAEFASLWENMDMDALYSRLSHSPYPGKQ